MSGLSPAARAHEAAFNAWQAQYGDQVHIYAQQHDYDRSHALVCTSLGEADADEAMAAYPMATGRVWARSPRPIDARDLCKCPKGLQRLRLRYEAKNITEEA